MLAPSPLAAAHSMDTTWFGVDEEGRVAQFESGEAGAVPRRAASAGGAGSPNFDTFALRAAMVARAIAAAPDDAPDAQSTAKQSFRAPSRALIVLRVSEEEAASYRENNAISGAERSVPSEHWIVLRPNGPRIVAYTKELSVKTLEALAARQDVLALLDEEAMSNWLYEAPSAAQTGVYLYRHGEWDIPGSYKSGGAPLEPLTLKELPEATQKALSQGKFPLRFEDAPKLQLADYFGEDECERWGDVTLRGEPKQPVTPPASRSTKPSTADLLTTFGVLAFAIMFLVVLFVLGRR